MFFIVLTPRGYVRCFIELQYNSLSSMMTWTAIIIPEEAGVVIFLGRSNDNVDPDYLPRNTQWYNELRQCECLRAIINLSVQASHRHRNSWKSHFLPQKVYKSAIWNESSVEWTLVDLDFAFVNDFQFWGCPTATKMTYFELHNKRLLLVYSWQFQDSLWKTLFLSEQIICINFLLIWFRSACSINLISVAVGQPLKPLI